MTDQKQEPLSSEDRIARLRKGYWIGYDPLINIRSRLEAFLTWPMSPRMPCAALIGESHNGKTTLLEKLQDRHNPKPSQPGDRVISDEPIKLRIVSIQSPPEPDPDLFYDAILGRLNMRGPRNEALSSKVERITDIFGELGTRILGIDEFGFQDAGGPVKRKATLNAIKHLQNHLRMSFVIAGVPSVNNALQADEQIGNRFEPLVLPKWRADARAQKLMASFEIAIKLKNPSGLNDKAITERCVNEGNGVIGHMYDLLRRLAEQAINNGSERITEASFSPTNLEAIGWVHPTQRFRTAEK